MTDELLLDTLARRSIDDHRRELAPPSPVPGDPEASAVGLGLRLVLEAGRQIRNRRYQPAAGGVAIKEDGSPATDLEHEIELLLRSWLPTIDPDAVVVGEETGGTLPERGDAVALDPIDGTRAFLAGTETFCTSFAWIRDRSARVGVVGNPVTGEIALAVADRGARLLRLSVFGEPDSTSRLGAATPDAPLLVNLHPNRHAGGVLQTLYERWSRNEVALVRSPGGSPAWALVEAARGQFSYANLWSRGETAPYDLAAGVLVLREAGGEIINLDGAPLDPFDHRGPFVAGIDPERTRHLAAVLRSVVPNAQDTPPDTSAS